MCEIVQNFIDQGITQGIEIGKFKNIVELEEKGLITLETALNEANISLEEYEIKKKTLGKYLS